MFSNTPHSVITVSSSRPSRLVKIFLDKSSIEMASTDKVERVIIGDVEQGVEENALVIPKKSMLKSVGIIAACSLAMMINVRDHASFDENASYIPSRLPIAPPQLSLFLL